MLRFSSLISPLLACCYTVNVRALVYQNKINCKGNNETLRFRFSPSLLVLPLAVSFIIHEHNFFHAHFALPSTTATLLSVLNWKKKELRLMLVMEGFHFIRSLEREIYFFPSSFSLDLKMGKEVNLFK